MEINKQLDLIEPFSSSNKIIKANFEYNDGDACSVFLFIPS